MSETNCYARLSHSKIFAEAKSEQQPSRRMPLPGLMQCGETNN